MIKTTIIIFAITIKPHVIRSIVIVFIVRMLGMTIITSLIVQMNRNLCNSYRDIDHTCHHHPHHNHADAGDDVYGHYDECFDGNGL